MTKPSRSTPARMQTSPETIAIMPASATARIGSPRGQRQHDGENERGQRRIRPEHQDAARAEQRVGQQRDDRRVEAVDAGHARRHGVGDADRHQHRRQHEAGHQVVREPGGFVMPQHLQPGQPARPAVHAVFLLAERRQRAYDVAVVQAPQLRTPLRRTCTRSSGRDSRRLSAASAARPSRAAVPCTESCSAGA